MSEARCETCEKELEYDVQTKQYLCVTCQWKAEKFLAEQAALEVLQIVSKDIFMNLPENPKKFSVIQSWKVKMLGKWQKAREKKHSIKHN